MELQTLKKRHAINYVTLLPTFREAVLYRRTENLSGESANTTKKK